jgi:hypothetical protein
MKISPRGIGRAFAAHEKSETKRHVMKFLHEAVHQGVGTITFDELSDYISVNGIHANDGDISHLDTLRIEIKVLLFEVVRDMANIPYQEGLVLWHQSNRIQMGIFGFQPTADSAVRVIVVFMRDTSGELRMTMSLETVAPGEEWYWPHSKHVCH